MKEDDLPIPYLTIARSPSPELLSLFSPASHYKYHTDMAHFALDENRFMQAAVHFTEALEHVAAAGRNPHAAYYNRGFAYLHMGYFHHAAIDLQESKKYPCSHADLQEANDKLIIAYRRGGKGQLEAGNYQAAIDNFTALIALQPLPDHHILLAKAYISLRPIPFDAVITHLKAANSLCQGTRADIPKHIAVAYADWGKELMAQGLPGVAKSRFEDAVSYHDHEAYHYNIADADWANGQKTAALQKITTLSGNQPDRLPPHWRKIIAEEQLLCHLQQNDCVAAYVGLTARYEQDPQSTIQGVPVRSYLSKAYYDLARQHITQKASLDTALEHLKKASQLRTGAKDSAIEPNPLDIDFTTATILTLKGTPSDLKSAQIMLQALSKKLPTDSMVRKHNINEALSVVNQKLNGVKVVMVR